ncbi:MAG: hypothetical protein V4489_10285 [Chlamydiota bacterium]
MSAITSSFGKIQNFGEGTLTRLTSDQSTQDKAYAVAMSALKAIAVLAAGVAIIALGFNDNFINGIFDALPNLAGIVALFVAMNIFLEPESNPRAAACRDHEWKKDAGDAQETKPTNTPVKQSELEKTSLLFHNGDHSKFAKLGTRQA